LRSGPYFVRTILLRAALAVMFAMTSHVTHADIYTWTDDSGRVNVSNLEPPAGAHVSRVTKGPNIRAPDYASARDAARQAEVAALSEQVRQLQEQVEVTRQIAAVQRPPPPVVYRIASPAYVHQWTPPPMPYVEPAPSYGCNPTWAGCFGWTGYWPSVVVVNAAPRRFSAFRHGRVDAHPMMRPHAGGRVH
jgi:hypothetical protein